MPSAPASIATSAARTGSGRSPALALRSVATWSTLTPRRSGGVFGMADSRENSEGDWDTTIVMRGLDPRSHLLRKDGLPGQARQWRALLPIDAVDPCDDGFGPQLG